ncbi:MAG: hypothetical protein NTU91_10950 [Chloroflexi bacterium]|nr:hypothetical protein [Chloroflexota bacterium]
MLAGTLYPDGVDGSQHGPAKLSGIRRLENEVFGVELHGTLSIGELRMAREEDNAHYREANADLLGKLKPIHSIHPDVREQDVHITGLELLQGLIGASHRRRYPAPEARPVDPSFQ